VNVLWDLAAHDLSIMDYVLPFRPCAVSATGISHVPNEPENVAYLTLFFETSIMAHIHVNWLAPVKIRRTLIGGARKMIVYDDIEPSEKIKIYDKGITVSNTPEHVYEMLISYRTGDMHAPQMQNTEALQTEVTPLLRFIAGEETPISGCAAGLQVVSLLEAASYSLKQRGRPVEIKSIVAAA
jgi:predicted dehydrogenase